MNGSQEEYSKTYKLSRPFLSRYINGKYEVPPKPFSLKILANSSKGKISYQELMQICGYLEIQQNTNSKQVKINSNKHQLERLYITKILQNANNKIIKYLSNINNDYTKEDYEIIKEDLFYMYQEISKLEVIKKNKEQFFELTFEDKFHYNSHFSSIDEELNYWNCLLKSNKGDMEAYNKVLGTEDRIKELKARKKKYNL